MITIQKKKEFIDWFLDNNILKNERSIEILRYFYFNNDVLDRVNFVSDLHDDYDYENVIYIPSIDIEGFKFYFESYFFEDGVFVQDVSEALDKIIWLNGEFHVCLDYTTDDKGFFDNLFVNKYKYEEDYDVEDMFDYQKDEKLYVEFLGEDFKNKTNNSNSYSKNLELYKYVKRDDLDLFVEKAEIDGRILVLKNKIDITLDNNDKELFLKLTDELLNLQKVVLK